jgi:CHAP domain-containing protein
MGCYAAGGARANRGNQLEGAGIGMCGWGFARSCLGTVLRRQMVLTLSAGLGLLGFAPAAAVAAGRPGTVGSARAAAVAGGVHRSAPVPPWWNGNCDVNNHPGSYPLGASFNGVQACGPGPLQGGYDQLVRFFPGAWGEYEWECVELVMRYMYLVYGIAPYSANGNTVVSNYSGTVLAKISNNGSSLPSPGDIVSMAGTSSNPNGHTGVVTAVNVTSGSGTVTIMEQNASSTGWGTISVSGGVLGSLVTGWLHNPKQQAAPPGDLLRSGSFEASAAGWGRTVPAGGTVNMVDYNTAAGAPAKAHDGNWYLAFNTNASGGGVYQDVAVNATAGTSFTGTAWLSSQSGTATGSLCLWGLGASNTNNCIHYSVGTGSYKQVQVVYDAPQNIATLRFQVYPTPGGGTTDMDTTSLVQNLLRSGSFEASAAGWGRTVPAGGTVNMVDYNTAAGAPAKAHDGNWYLAFNTNASGGGVYQDVAVNATAGTSFTGTAWLSSQSGTATGSLCLWGLGASNTNNCIHYSVGTGSYKQVQVVYDAPQNIATLRFQVYPTPGGGTTDMDTTSLK